MYVDYIMADIVYNKYDSIYIIIRYTINILHTKQINKNS